MKKSIRRLTLCALFLAFSLALSFLEQQLPVLPFLPPGVKLGLSNLAVMTALFFLGFPNALIIGLLKALFVLLTRGMIAGLLSASGALLSVSVMALARKLKSSYLLTSIFGAIAHNIGQLTAVSLWLGSPFFSYYLPLLVLSGMGMGFLTGFCVRLLMPAVEKLPLGREGLS